MGNEKITHSLQTEAQYFSDPALDRAMSIIMTLAAELHVVKDRLRSLEVLLVEGGTIAAGALDHYVPTDEERRHLEIERKSMVSELMRCILGLQVSKGAAPDLLQRFQ